MTKTDPNLFPLSAIKLVQIGVRAPEVTSRIMELLKEMCDAHDKETTSMINRRMTNQVKREHECTSTTLVECVLGCEEALRELGATKEQCARLLFNKNAETWLGPDGKSIPRVREVVDSHFLTDGGPSLVRLEWERANNRALPFPLVLQAPRGPDAPAAAPAVAHEGAPPAVPPEDDRGAAGVAVVGGLGVARAPTALDNHTTEDATSNRTSLGGNQFQANLVSPMFGKDRAGVIPDTRPASKAAGGNGSLNLKEGDIDESPLLENGDDEQSSEGESDGSANGKRKRDAGSEKQQEGRSNKKSSLPLVSPDPCRGAANFSNKGRRGQLKDDRL